MQSLNDRYELVRELGNQVKRKFGRVFLLRDRGDQTLLVMKITPKKGVSDAVLERSRRESDFSFRENGLPEVVFVEETADELILVKRFQEGIPLDVFWEQVPSRERVSTLKAICNALLPVMNSLQEKQLVHADLKPSNMLIRESDGELRVELIDFGLSIRRNEVPDVPLLFPLGYAAPELILNRLHLLDTRTDIFSLGIIFWRLFAGKLPLLHPNPSVYTNLQITYPLPDHSAIPGKLYPILQKMAAKHTFATAPNLLSEREMDKQLLEGMAQRYSNFTEVNDQIQQLKDKRFRFF